MSALAAPPPLAERDRVDAAAFAAEVVPAGVPVVLRGQVADWPAVAAARAGDRALADYIAGFDNGRPAEIMAGAPGTSGRFFYRDDMAGFNFARGKASLGALMAKLLSAPTGEPAQALYAGATAAPDHLPGWAEANPLGLPVPGATARVWIGNATRIATHYDASSNIACVVAGTRRFTLFPPGQVANLYVGPLDVTMAGQPASMVDVAAPDLDRYPRFAEAWRHARVAELRPGDALYMPPLWWHDVAATGAFNVLVNYWWGQGDTPAFGALIHALLALRDCPAGERAAWRAMFDHYVFADGAATAADHLPDHARGVLGPPSPARTARIRQYLAQMLGL